jgi:hypothetical protein
VQLLINLEPISGLIAPNTWVRLTDDRMSLVRVDALKAGLRRFGVPLQTGKLMREGNVSLNTNSRVYDNPYQAELDIVTKRMALKARVPCS